jgi:hypothetical protein
MGSLESMTKLTQKLALLALIGLTTGGSLGCAYGGIAAAPDGTVYVARNDLLLFGLLRKVFICKPAGTALACTEAASAP